MKKKTRAIDDYIPTDNQLLELKANQRILIIEALMAQHVEIMKVTNFGNREVKSDDEIRAMSTLLARADEIETTLKTLGDG